MKRKKDHGMYFVSEGEKMKVDKKVKEEILKNLDLWLNEFISKMQLMRAMMNNAEQEEEMMAIKRDMLIIHFGFAPLGNDHSYFCMKMLNVKKGIFDCQNCPYGMLHGICIDPSCNSDYGRIIMAQSKIIDMVRQYHRKEDNYEMADKLKETKGSA